MARTKQKSPASTGVDVKFCVCAVLDLQGFSSHLETSGYDLRTTIGEQAVRRLQNLESALERIRAERVGEPGYYSHELTLRRMNDAVIVTMDLSDLLLPSVGQTSFSGPTPERIERFAESRGREFEESSGAEYESALALAVDPLLAFLGLVARLHLFIQRCESEGLYPGAKTVVSTGYRKPFVTPDGSGDPLSANFAMSNAFAASVQLHGPHLFVDNNIIELLCRNDFGRNLIQLAHFHWNESPFDAFAVQDEHRLARMQPEVPPPLELLLFRRSYVYRRLNPSPASFLQAISGLRPFLDGSRQPDLTNIFYAHVYHAINRGLSSRRITELDPPQSFVYAGTNDLTVPIGDFYQFLADGHQATTAARHRRRRLAELGIKSPDEAPVLWRELEALYSKTVTLEIEPLGIADLLPMLWSLGEESVSGLEPLLSGDRTLLDYPSD